MHTPIVPLVLSVWSFSHSSSGIRPCQDDKQSLPEGGYGKKGPASERGGGSRAKDAPRNPAPGSPQSRLALHIGGQPASAIQAAGRAAVRDKQGWKLQPLAFLPRRVRTTALTSPLCPSRTFMQAPACRQPSRDQPALCLAVVLARYGWGRHLSMDGQHVSAWAPPYRWPGSGRPLSEAAHPHSVRDATQHTSSAF